MANRREQTQVEQPNSEERNLTYQLQHTPWRERLNVLGSRWVRNTPEHSAAFLAQVNEAWELAYLHIWNLQGNNGVYARFTDDERNDAAIHMRTALMNYDPARQNLLKFVEQKSILLLKGAWARGIDIEYDVPESEEYSQDWKDELDAFQKCSDGSSEWVDSMASILYTRYSSRIKSKFFKKEQRIQVLDSLKTHLYSYDPQQLSLEDYVDQWLTETLGGSTKASSKKGILGPSIDIKIGEDEDITIGDMIPNSAPLVEDLVTAKISVWSSITALASILNFQESMNPHIADTDEEHRNNRMCYTEKVLFLAQNSPVPQSRHKDILRAMLISYLNYFSIIPNDGSPINLTTLDFKTVEQIEDPSSPTETWVTPLNWREGTDFLPAKVPINYLKHHHGITHKDPYITKIRKEFYKYLRKLAKY